MYPSLAVLRAVSKQQFCTAAKNCQLFQLPFYTVTLLPFTFYLLLCLCNTTKIVNAHQYAICYVQVWANATLFYNALALSAQRFLTCHSLSKSILSGKARSLSLHVKVEESRHRYKIKFHLYNHRCYAIGMLIFYSIYLNVSCSETFYG